MILYLLIFQNYQAVKDPINNRLKTFSLKSKPLVPIYSVFQKEGFIHRDAYLWKYKIWRLSLFHQTPQPVFQWPEKLTQPPMSMA